MTDTPDVPFCPATGAAMHRDVRPMTLTYRGETLTFDMPGWYCEVSEESIHTGADMKVSDRMLNLLKARAERLLDPEEIRRIRRKLQLTQVQAGEIIGGGPRAFQKYETGDLLPSKAISSALVLLDDNPGALTVLRRKHAAPLPLEARSATAALDMVVKPALEPQYIEHHLPKRRIEMDKKRLFVERRPQGDYAVRRPDSERASAVAPTQKAAIERARELSPGRQPLVERVRNTETGGRDQWRKP